MKLEKPRICSDGDALQRIEALERYLYRLVWELEIALQTLEQQGGNANGKNL